MPSAGVLATSDCSHVHETGVFARCEKESPRTTILSRFGATFRRISRVLLVLDGQRNPGLAFVFLWAVLEPLAAKRSLTRHDITISGK